jgi:hypothetical protein
LPAAIFSSQGEVLLEVSHPLLPKEGAMAMRETRSSLQLYFGLSGVAAVLIGLRDLAAGELIQATVGIVLGGAYVFVAVRLEPLLLENPGLIKMILYISSGLMAVGIAANLYLQNASASIQEVIGLLINWYLLVNVSRLSSAAHGNPPTQSAG